MSTTSTTTRSALPPQPDEIAAIAARIGAEIAAANAASVDTEARFPTEVFNALREERLLSAMIPTEFGGAGARLSDITLAVEALSEHCASAGMIYAMHQIQVAALVRHSSNAWQQDFLREVAARELLLGSATTEKGIGGDVRSSSCAVETTGDRFHLVKNASVISYGLQSDAIMVTARRDPDSPPNDQVFVVVPVTGATLEQDSDWNALGFRGTCSDGFVLTADGGVDQIMDEGYDVISAKTMLPTSHVMWSSVWLGIANSAVDTAHRFVRKNARKNPGATPPAALRLAELVGQHEEFRSLVRTRVADYQAALHDDAELASMGFALRMNSLKVSSSTVVVEIVAKALSVCGFAGYQEGTPFSLGRHLRDAHGAALMVNNDRLLGANAQMLLIHKGER